MSLFGPVETTYEYCSVCDAKHTMLDGGDIYDCMVYYRNNVEIDEVKKKREYKVEVWDQNNKVWVKKSEWYGSQVQK